MSNNKIFNVYDTSRIIQFSFSLYSKPQISINIQNPLSPKKEINVLAILDSGADNTCAPCYLAKLLGHDIKKKKPATKIIPFSGIGGSVNGYFHSASISINKKQYSNNSSSKLETIPFLKPIKTDIVFLENFKGPVLLGRNDFFNNFIFSFYNFNKFSNLVLVPNKKIVIY